LAILTQVADSLRVASIHGIDVVIYPELFLTGGHSSQQQYEQTALDREDTKFNIIGNICEELNVACIIGYAESIHESELKTSFTDDSRESLNAYNSIMAFNACGTRAGNYRSISKHDDFRSGYSFVESTPMLLQLPNRDTSKGEEREIKIGLMCGNDILSPEHSRNLVSSGAQILVASTSFTNTKFDTRVVECVLPTRALENQVPFLFANYESQEDKTNEGDLEFTGSSAIVSKDGDYLVRAPRKEGEDMPDCGYLIPCEVGTLYAADINIEPTSNTNSNDQWDLKARMPDEVLGQQSNKKQAIGFGNISSKRKAKKLKP